MPIPSDCVRCFRRLHVLILGDAMLDTYLEGTAARLCSEGPVPVVRKLAERHVPGGAANTAANVRALGANVRLLSYRGMDTAGELLVTALRELDVATDWLVPEARSATIHKVRVLADGHYVVRWDEGDANQHTPADELRLTRWFEDALAWCDVLLVSDYGYGATPEAVIARLRSLRRPARRPVVVIDSKQLHRFQTCGATMVTPNHLEARLLVERWSRGVEAHEEGLSLAEAFEPIGRRLLTLLDAEHAAITLAHEGALLLDRQGNAVHVEAQPIARAHDVGAGDSFAAALALALGAGATPLEATRIGIAAAGIAVSRPCTTVVSQHELLQRVSLADHLHAQHGASTAQRARTRLAARLARERAAGRTIVFTNGVFDILHAGHVAFLRQARALGDVLVVGVNSDQSAQRRNGHARPITSERDRLALVNALDSVDEAILFDDETPVELIRALRPHIHVKGGDYAEEPIPEADAVRAVGGHVVILPLAGAPDTNVVIQRILSRATPALPALPGLPPSAGLGGAS